VTVTEQAFMDTGGEAPIYLNITGPQLGQLVKYAGQVENIVRTTRGTLDVKSSWEPKGKPEIIVSVNRLRAAEMGISVAEIARAVRASMEGETATQFRDSGKEVDIRVRLHAVDRLSSEDVGRITLMNRQGDIFPLSQVADLSRSTGPSKIWHRNRQQLITVTANNTGRSMGDITAEIDRRVKELHLPPGYGVTYAGEREAMDDSFKDLVSALLISVFLVYMVLVILYESFLTPFIRMLSLPCGFIGALLALFLTGNSISMASMIGFIMLDGLAAKNGTLLIDYTITLMKRGLPLREALIEAGTTRLRPIVMTSMTMIFGMLPTAFALGEGSEIRSGMAVVLIGGLLTSTIITPLLIPVAYTLIEDGRDRWRAWWIGRFGKGGTTRDSLQV